MGNGGSAADCQHFATELVVRYKLERGGLPAISLSTDTSILTAIGNDYCFERIFERQIDALANKSDLVFGFSTSGNSENIIQGIEQAKDKGCKTIAILGNTGGKIKGMSDIELFVQSNITARIQEGHMLIYHMICELIDDKFWKSI